MNYRDHSSPIYATTWSPNGAYIASGGEDKTIQMWEATTGKSICTYKGHDNSVKSLTWSPDSKYIASGSDDKTVQIWEAASGKSITTYGGHTRWVRAVAWSYDGQYIASASNEINGLETWRPKGGDNLGCGNSHTVGDRSF